MTSKSPVRDVSVVTLIRTGTTLDHSQKAEKVCCTLGYRSTAQECWKPLFFVKQSASLDKFGREPGYAIEKTFRRGSQLCRLPPQIPSAPAFRATSSRAYPHKTLYSQASSQTHPIVQARLPVFSCCVGNQSAQEAMLPGLCRTNTALLLQTCPILDESLAWVRTLISMLNLGV